MTLRKNKWLFLLLSALVLVGGSALVSYGQFTVTLSAPSGPGPTPSPTPNPSPTATPAPTGSFTVSAAVTGNTNSIAKVVFYRNDVPFETDTSSPYQLSQTSLGQDTYTYRARAYDSTGVWVDSADWVLTVKTPRVFRMGDAIPSPSYQTHGPGPEKDTDQLVRDHTQDIRKALEYLESQGGGTLFFPCVRPPNPLF